MKADTRASHIQCLGTMSFEKQEKRKIVHTLQPKWFFARSSLSISPVCDGTCAKRWLVESLIVGRTGELVTQDNPEAFVFRTELMTTNKSLRTNENVQRNLHN